MEDLKQLKKAIEMDVNRIKVDQLKASEEFEALWKDFDENGVDYGPYMEGEINVNKGKVRRKSKAGIDDQVTHCSFCKNNGREEVHYKSHIKTTCQILKKYKCPVCGINGHTRRYCPKKPVVEG